MNSILSTALEINDNVITNRRTLHQNPELSFQEFETSLFIKQELDELGIQYQTVLDTGICALIGKGDRCLALRSDIDALPVTEETGLSFSSVNQGVMHACGHDMHIAMLLGAAEILKKHESELNGVVKLIFQPGEEKLPGGASLLIEEGILKDPKPEAVFGQHIFPEAASGTIALSSGYVMASTDEIYITLTSKGSHAAQPHMSGDPILAASQIVNHLQSIITKFRDPLDSAVISITSFHAGSTTNIIPAEAKLMGTMRTFSKDLRATIKTLIRDNCEMIAKMHGVGFELNIVEGYPSLYNNEAAVEAVKSSALSIVPSENIVKFIPKMWAEDFAYYAQEVPSCFWFLGVKPKGIDSMPPLHNSKLSPDENALHIGAALLAKTAIDWLERPLAT